MKKPRWSEKQITGILPERDTGAKCADPQAWLSDVLDRIHDHKINCLDELMPRGWRAACP